MECFVLFVALAQVSCICAGSSSWNVPFILWSNQEVTPSPVLYIRDVLSRDTIVNMIATSSSKLPFTQPDVLLVFSYPELRTDEVANIAVVKHQVLNTSSPVVIFPHVRETFESEAVQCASPAQVVSYLENQTGLEQTMVSLVLEIGEKSTTEAQMVTLIDHLTKDHRETKILFSITGTKATLPFAHVRDQRMLQLSRRPFTCPSGYYVNLANPARPTCFSHFVAMTPGILTGIMISFFMVLLACVGFSSLHQIQTPQRYATVPPPKGKEF